MIFYECISVLLAILTLAKLKRVETCTYPNELSQ
jgi:hypothetical protein